MIESTVTRGPPHRIRVLHVDDDPAFVEMTAEFLERRDDDFEVVTETSAAAALEQLETARIDCVVSDYDMPGRTGVELLEAVRERFGELPFVLFTGKGSEAVASEAISAGVTDYLQKGTGTERYALLANRLRNAVDAARSTEQLAERKRRLETLISNLPGIVYRCSNDPGWPMVAVEGECEALTGYTAAQLVDGDVSWGEDVLHPDDRDAMWAEVQTALEADESFEVVYRIRTADGDDRWMWERGRAVDGADDGERVIEGFIADITARKRREEDLQRTNTLLSTLFEALPAGVVVEDADREVLALNQRLLDLFERSAEPEDVVRSDCRAFADDLADRFAAPEAFIERVDELVADRVAAEDDVELRDDRTLRRIHRPIEFETGHGHLWMYQEVTEEVHYERELERYERILDASGDPVYALDETGRFTYVNERLADLVGYDREALLGEHPSMLLPDEGVVDTIESEIGRLLDTEADRTTVEIDVTTADGEHIPAELHTSLLSTEDGFDGTVGVVRNISDRVARERQLDQFASVVSHDLRNPLGVAQGNLELARDRLDDEPDQLSTVADAHERMAELIDDLLELARADREVDAEPVDVGTLAADCWRAVPTSTAQLRVTLDRDVVATPSRLRQLLENLFRNAVEHGPAGAAAPTDDDAGSTALTVTVGALADGSGFYVADDGRGLSTTDADRLFDAGYSTAEDGTGFGLTIVESVARAHGWSVATTTSDEGGAQFEFTGVEWG